jgi:hypothetical protein
MTVSGPRTKLLGHGLNGANWASYFIYEEEVPRSGAVVSSSWQRTRWHYGKVVFWQGIRKQNCRGEGNRGLRFDYLTEKGE